MLDINATMAALFSAEFKRRLMDDRFERLEKQGKLKKYQERREKKLSKKDRHPVP